jgi:hypothetical protein
LIQGIQLLSRVGIPMVKINSSVINGYVYNMENDGRSELVEQYADLLSLSQDWNVFISTDNVSFPEYWNNASQQAISVFNRVNTILNGVYTGVYPWNNELVITLAPPGNSLLLNENTANPVYIKSTGAIYNLWAMGLVEYMKDNEVNDSSWQTNFNPNNVWNNSLAQAKALDTNFGNLITLSNRAPDQPESTSQVPLDPSSTVQPWYNYIRGMTTVPLVAPYSNVLSNYTPDGTVSTSYNYNVTDKSSTWGGDITPAVSQEMNVDSTSSTYRNFLVQALYDFRNLCPSNLQDAIGNITSSFTYNNVTYDAAQIVLRPAIQDMLYFQYALTGEGQLQRELGTSTDMMRVSEDVLTALNLIEKSIAANVKVDRHLNPTDTYSLWQYASFLTSGYSMLKQLYNEGVIQNSDRLAMVKSVLNLASYAAVNLMPYLDGAGPSTGATWYTPYVSWWSGNLASNTNNNAITQWQNQNNNLQQNLKEAVFVYQEFVKSASSLLRKLNQLVRSTAQQIKGS